VSDKYELFLDTGIYADGVISMTLRSATEHISKWVVNTREESFKSSLEKLGWTPPGAVLAKPACAWSLDEWHDYYDTACGNALCLETGTPAESKCIFCPCCGGRISVVEKPKEQEPE
jgi:hypothetical protein